MGSTLSHELAWGEFNISREQAIAIQLQSNHYPPVPLSMVQACMDAIDACNIGENGTLIDLPDGVSYRGENRAPAHAIVTSHHLEPWIDYEE
jgi:(2Fe-2S) ferredoxin